jgi:exosortase C (VPDSG-CTERM-specific)
VKPSPDDEKLLGKRKLYKAFVKIAEPSGEVTKPGRVASEEIGCIFLDRDPDQKRRRRTLGYLCYIALLMVAFAKPLYSLAVHSATTDLDSYILLVPFISAYLLRLRRQQLPTEYVCSPAWAILPIAVGLAALAATWSLHASARHISHNDFLALMALAFVCFLAAGGFLFLGRRWMAATLFPICFLLFLVPLPDVAVKCLETASKLASTEVANQFFRVAAVPVLRDGTGFQLPGITLEVAQECSGMHSSWALFIASLLVSSMFLKSSWRRLVLVAFVIPLGILRNGFRIFVIGWLCVHMGPQMINSVIHRHGGPIFFALSLIPLVFLLRRLQSGERSRPMRPLEERAQI